jgi:hypothetical protein
MRQREEENDPNDTHTSKKILLHVPALEVCLGKDNLHILREQEGLTPTNNVMGIEATSVFSGRPLDGELLEGVDESRLVQQPTVDTGNIGLGPVRVSMRGDTEIDGPLK